MPIIRKNKNVYINRQVKTTTPYYNRKILDCSDNCQEALTEEIIKNVCCNTPTVHGSSSINEDYYTSSSQYLYNRCMTTAQNAFNFTSDASGNLYKHCPSDSNFCKRVYYKPNNLPFNKQGAVRASNRIQRLKYDTLVVNQNSECPACGAYNNGQTPIPNSSLNMRCGY